MKYTYTYEANGNAVQYGDLAETVLNIQSDHPGCVLSDEWEPCGDAERRLVWASEADADNDDGAAAIGQIVREANES